MIIKFNKNGAVCTVSNEELKNRGYEDPVSIIKDKDGLFHILQEAAAAAKIPGEHMNAKVTFSEEYGMKIILESMTKEAFEKKKEEIEQGSEIERQQEVQQIIEDSVKSLLDKTIGTARFHFDSIEDCMRAVKRVPPRGKSSLYRADGVDLYLTADIRTIKMYADRMSDYYEYIDRLEEPDGKLLIKHDAVGILRMLK